MVQTPHRSPHLELPLYVPPTLRLTVSAEQFADLAAANRDLCLERTAQGVLIMNPPTGWQTGERNSNISGELYLWWRNAGKPGKVFDSSTAFTLANGAIRSPDASWVSPERWDALTSAQKCTFPQVCPDVVIELRSTSDALKPLQAKMQEYLANGARLGWLIDPQHRTVEVYRSGAKVEILTQPNALTEAAILPDFVLDVQQLWN